MNTAQELGKDGFNHFCTTVAIFVLTVVSDAIKKIVAAAIFV